LTRELPAPTQRAVSIATVFLQAERGGGKNGSRRPARNFATTQPIGTRTARFALCDDSPSALSPRRCVRSHLHFDGDRRALVHQLDRVAPLTVPVGVSLATFCLRGHGQPAPPNAQPARPTDRSPVTASVASSATDTQNWWEMDARADEYSTLVRSFACHHSPPSSSSPRSARVRAQEGREDAHSPPVCAAQPRYAEPRAERPSHSDRRRRHQPCGRCG
jgi:hypothetical protein